MIVPDQEPLQFDDQLGECEHRRRRGPRGRIAGQARQEHLGDGLEEPLDPPPAAGPRHAGVDQADLQVGGHLLQMAGGEVAGFRGTAALTDSRPGRRLSSSRSKI
jgi:hypothetical protein